MQQFQNDWKRLCTSKCGNKMVQNNEEETFFFQWFRPTFCKDDCVHKMYVNRHAMLPLIKATPGLTNSRALPAVFQSRFIYSLQNCSVCQILYTELLILSVVIMVIITLFNKTPAQEEHKASTVEHSVPPGLYQTFYACESLAQYPWPLYQNI